MILNTLKIDRSAELIAPLMSCDREMNTVYLKYFEPNISFIYVQISNEYQKNTQKAIMPQKT